MIEPILIVPAALVAITYWYVMSLMAINMRNQFSDEIDTYLGDDENPEELKLYVINAFEDSLDHWLPIKFLYFFFLARKNKDKPALASRLKSMYGEEHVIKAGKLLGKMLAVNLRLSPIQYLTLSLVGINVIFFMVLFHLPGIAFQKLSEKTETAIQRAAHF